MRTRDYVYEHQARNLRAQELGYRSYWELRKARERAASFTARPTGTSTRAQEEHKPVQGEGRRNEVSEIRKQQPKPWLAEVSEACEKYPEARYVMDGLREVDLILAHLGVGVRITDMVDMEALMDRTPGLRELCSVLLKLNEVIQYPESVGLHPAVLHYRLFHLLARRSG